jgi:predicted O-linked N-acetylglucosamine transferase (SPINDLY family)
MYRYILRESSSQFDSLPLTSFFVTSAEERATATTKTRQLRLGYISRRFEDYPGTQLMLRVFGGHERARFHVSSFAHGPEDGSSERATVRETSDSFVDISTATSAAAAAALRDAELDVLIDYDGMHGFNSMEVLSLRPVPLQLTWLGFAGSSGSSATVDVLVSDSVVAPPEEAPHYAEALLYLPHTCVDLLRSAVHGAPTAAAVSAAAAPRQPFADRCVRLVAAWRYCLLASPALSASARFC